MCVNLSKLMSFLLNVRESVLLVLILYMPVSDG